MGCVISLSTPYVAPAWTVRSRYIFTWASPSTSWEPTGSTDRLPVEPWWNLGSKQLGHRSGTVPVSDCHYWIYMVELRGLEPLTS